MFLKKRKIIVKSILIDVKEIIKNKITYKKNKVGFIQQIKNDKTNVVSVNVILEDVDETFLKPIPNYFNL